MVPPRLRSSMEEYMQVALVSSGYEMLSTNSFVGMGDLATQKAFEWMSSCPLIVRASTILSRLMNDLVSHKVDDLNIKFFSKIFTNNFLF